MKNHEQVKQNTIFESMYKINVEDVTFSVIRGGEKDVRISPVQFLLM